MNRIAATLVVFTIATGAFASPIPDFPFVFARGKATIEVEPDTATMLFRIVSFRENSSNAVAEVRSRSVDVINFLGKQGFGKGTLVSYEIDKSVVRERENYVELKILGYEATRRLKLTIDEDLTGPNQAATFFAAFYQPTFDKKKIKWRFKK